MKRAHAKVIPMDSPELRADERNEVPARDFTSLSVPFESVLRATTKEQFLSQLVKFANELGFDKVSALSVHETLPGQPEFASIGNYHPAFHDAMRHVPNIQRDPVMKHIRHQSVPIAWDQATYTTNGSGELWEEQAAFGYKSGIALALHLPAWRHFAIGVERDRPLPSDIGELRRMAADLQLFAVYAHESALQLLPPPSLHFEVPTLTTRETEALRWTMAGKTAWEVGMILNIAERTAVVHIANAMKKLDCTNKHQAVLRAYKLGLIT